MSAPVKHTCPDIDALIISIDAAIAEANKGCEIVDSNSPAEDCFREILSELKPLEKQLESLRKDNAALRDWGEKGEHRIGELEKENEWLEKQNGKQQREIDDMGKDISYLEREIEELKQVTENN